MLKVFLVEDEVVVREGIKNNIDWAGNGYDFCGEASDGELAFPMIQKLQPDIVITDIKMPFMDGLELSRMIKAQYPSIEIIILSGHQEFAYAKEAIKIGVSRYLSKPINGEMLLREVNALARKIEEERAEAQKEAPIENFDMGVVNPKQMDRDKVRNFLKVGSLDEVDSFVASFFNNLEGRALESTIFRQYLIMDIYFAVMEFVEELSLDKEQIEAFDVGNGRFAGVDEVSAYVARIIRQAITLREGNAVDRHADVVERVCAYIEENYANDELTLNTVAAYVNFSANHLSGVFAQKTGKPFIKYLTDFRMNKAKELLRCTGMRSSEVSLAVGYKDPHYFSSLFKKTQGMTPTQYRGKE